MARKKAKFHIEVDYEDKGGDLSTKDMKILRCESEGDFKGITLAMTTGLAFAAEKDFDNDETFQKKLRLLRGTASALTNCLLILKDQGVLEKDVDATLIKKMSDDLKETIDTISYGICKVLNVSEETLIEFNKEYREENLNKEDNGKSREQGLESDDFEDYL